MKFLERVLAPDPSRAPAFDSVASHNSPSNGEVSHWFRFQCLGCSNEIKLDLPSYISNYSDREQVLGYGHSEEIRLHYGLQNSNSLAGGWPKFRVEYCSHCNIPYLVYVAVHEPSNGWYKIVPQGITQLAP